MSHILADNIGVPLHIMSSWKRPRKLGDIVCVLDITQKHVDVDDYNYISMLLCLYDKTERKLAREQKKYTSKASLYSKTCHEIFEDFLLPLLGMSKIGIVLERIELVTNESKTLSKNDFLSDTISKIYNLQKIEYVAKNKKIVIQCSQFQTSIRIKSMSHIMQVNRQSHRDKSAQCVFIECFLPEYLLTSKQCLILNFFCLLGAIILFTNRKKNEVAKAFLQICSLKYAANVCNQIDLEKAESNIYHLIEKERKSKSVKKKNTKAKKVCMKNLDKGIAILELQHQHAKGRLRDIRLEIVQHENTSENRELMSKITLTTADDI